MSVPDEYRAAIEGVALFDVSDRGKVEVAGRDAVSFLHNLSTADVKNLKPGFGCETFLATAKAKTIAYALLFHRPGAVWLDVGSERGPAVFQHLDHFLISEQVELGDRTAELAQFHLRGPDAARLVSAVVGVPSLPPAGLATLDAPGPVEVRRVGPQAFDLLFERQGAEERKRVFLDAGTVFASAQTYEILRVEAGLPQWGAELDENRSVFEVGLNQRAICYTKGCYLGQEPIVMARDRGHINRTLLGLKLEGTTLPAAGARVLRGDEEVGQVTSSALSPRLGAIALAYLKRGHQEPGLVLAVDGAAATVAGLPFAG